MPQSILKDGIHSKNLGKWGKVGRPPKGWKPQPKPILKIKKGPFIISFS